MTLLTLVKNAEILLTTGVHHNTTKFIVEVNTVICEVVSGQCVNKVRHLFTHIDIKIYHCI
jgi:predicted nucleic acid-binding protein